MSQLIPESHKDLLEKPAFGNLGTLMTDGSPQVTPVWVDYDGEFVRFNSAKGRVKDKNVRRDPRISISLQDPANPSIRSASPAKCASPTKSNRKKSVRWAEKKTQNIRLFFAQNLHRLDAGS